MEMEIPISARLWSALLLALGFHLAACHGHTLETGVWKNAISHNFTIHSWDVGGLVRLAGDAKLGFEEGRNGHHHSTYVDLVPHFKKHSVGRATFHDHVPIWKFHAHSNGTFSPYSFVTSFTFTITRNGHEQAGDGFTFFIDSYPHYRIPQSSSGGNLGLYSTSKDFAGDPRVRIVAVEFDTYANWYYSESSDNHVGCDVHDIVSTVSTDLGEHSLNLTSGKEITVQIEYNAAFSRLDVYMNYGKHVVKESSHVLFTGMDLSRLMPKPYAYVGFSASTGSNTQSVHIKNWVYKSWQVNQI